MDRPIVELDCAEADARRETHDRIAMNAGQSLDRADATSLGQGSDNGDLLVKR